MACTHLRWLPARGRAQWGTLAVFFLGGTSYTFRKPQPMAVMAYLLSVPMQRDTYLRCSRSRQDFGRSGDRPTDRPNFWRIRLQGTPNAYVVACGHANGRHQGCQGWDACGPFSLRGELSEAVPIGNSGSREDFESGTACQAVRRTDGRSRVLQGGALRSPSQIGSCATKTRILANSATSKKERGRL